MGVRFLGGQGLLKASSTRNSVIRFDTGSKKMRAALRNTATAIGQSDYNGMRITPDGLLALVGSTGTPFLRVLDPVAENWITPIATLPGSTVNSIAFNSAGDRFAVAFQSSPFLYEYAYPSFVIQPTPAVPPSSSATGVSYNGAGTKLAVALFGSPYLEVFNVATGAKEAIVWASMPATGTGADVSFNTAGTQVAYVGSAGLLRSIRVWAYPSGTLLFSDNSATATYKCEFCPDDTKLAVMRISGSSGIRIYNTSTFTFTDINTTMTDYINTTTRNIKWIDNRFLFFASEGGSCTIIDTTTGLPVAGVEHTFNTAVGIGCISPLTVARKLAGNVKDAGLANVARVVRAYNTETGDLMGEVTSDPTTGNFSMLVFSAAPMTVFAVGIGGENAKVYNPVTPAAYP
jgi:WD40 repeat protein